MESQSNPPALARTLSFILASLAVAACLPEAASGTFPGENGRIALGCGELRAAICVTEPGSHVTTYLTDSGHYEAMPSFSADGTRIAFMRQVGRRANSRHTEIFVMRANGPQVERLTHTGLRVGNSHPSFTPGGSQIVFQRGRERIMIMADDGSGVEQLGVGEDPAVSPDGERVAFRRDDDSGSRLYTMVIDGSEVDPIAGPADTWDGSDPGWSPDGEEIVFTYYAGAPTFEQGIFSVPSSGGDAERVGPEQLPGGGDRSFEPTPSPDGTHVAFLAVDCEDEECPSSLYVSTLDGSSLTDLGTARAGSYPDWGVRTPGSPRSGRCNVKQATIVGTDRDDVITGTPARDVISARRGSDRVRGLGGNDLICGGRGEDRLRGGSGNDRLDGGPNRDRCAGGAGRDRLSGC